ncbi:MAG: glycosyltransferase, partial [Acidimicrobiia bacterium]
QLRCAIRSVVEQDFEGSIEHLVVVDDDEVTVSSLAGTIRPRRRPLRVLSQGPCRGRRDGDREFVYPHLARLLNVGVAAAQSKWVAFLDDDNTFEPSHLRSLISLADECGVRAVHSGRQFVWPNGEAFLEPFLPSASSIQEGRRLYEILCERGVWIRGTNIVLDRVDERATDIAPNSTVMSSDDPVFLVDQNLWLIERNLLLEHPIPDRFSAEEIADNTCPDDKMLGALVSAGVKIVSSGRATVRYTVGGGGISNGAFMIPNTA